VKQSVLEIFNGNGMTAFQESLRDGVHNICCTVQQRVMEVIDGELRNDISLREGWVIERRNDETTIVSPFGEVSYERTYFQNKPKLPLKLYNYTL
jgi:hypothetical protein